jgi:hypothetical protein
MNIKYLPAHLGLGLALAIAGVVAQTSPARAQTGNQSDTTGAIVTTSDIVGGFRFDDDPERRIAFRTSAAQTAANTAAVSLNQTLAARNLPVVATDPSQTPISATVQQNLEIILTNRGNVSAAQAQLVSELVSARGNQTLAQNLVSSLVGLTATGRVSAEQFLIVIRAYNAFIESSTIEVFSNNPNPLRGIRAILAILLNATLAIR